MLRINTKTNKIPFETQYKIVQLTHAWCKETLPAPKRRRRKPLCVMVHKSIVQEYGNYCPRNNWLTINLGVCNNIYDIVSTTIHEYVHYIQDLKHYAKFEREVGYDKNPYEVEAREYEMEQTKKCWEQIKSQI